MGPSQFVPLYSCQLRADLDDIVPYSLIHLGWVLVANIIEDIACERAIASANLINHQIVIRIVLEHIFGEYTLSNSLAIPRLRRKDVDNRTFVGVLANARRHDEQGRP